MYITFIITCTMNRGRTTHAFANVTMKNKETRHLLKVLPDAGCKR